MYRRIKNPWLGKEGYDCMGCCPENPIGLHMHFYVDGETVIGEWHPSEHYQGWIDTLHGGVQAIILDETAAWYVGYFKQVTGMTTQLDVKYLKPVSTRWERVEARATKVAEDRARITIHVELLSPEGVVCSAAEATYFMNPRQLKDDRLKVRFELEE